MSFFRCTLGLFAILFFSGFGAAAQTTAAAEEQPAISREITLRPGDLLRIRVWPNQELGGEFLIEETGLVSLPIVGEIRAGGRALGELREEILSRYGAALKSPVIGITPVYTVSLLGAVQRPGLYPVTPSQSLFDLISLAGGLREDANDEKITIVRNGESTVIDARAALSGAESGEIAMLRSGDRIIVAKRRKGITFQAVTYALQSVTLVVGVVNLFLR